MGIRDRDFYFETAMDTSFNKDSILIASGRNSNVGTSFVPVTCGGIYQYKKPSEATQLRVKAGNVNDAQGGTGAIAIGLLGINAQGILIREVLLTNGTSAGAASINSYMRLLSATVVASGTYATVEGGSHVGDIAIENTAGTEDWILIDATDFPKGNSEVAMVTIPKGFEGAVTDFFYTVDSTLKTDLIIMGRPNILNEDAPVAGAVELFIFEGQIQELSISARAPLFIPELTDIMVFAKVAVGNGAVALSSTIIIRPI